MSIAGVKTVVSAFSDARADYDMSRASRFIRRRTGVAPTGSGEDWNYRAEIKYYQDIEQARDMDRNDGLVGCLADRRVDNIVQQGFTLDTKTGDKALDQDLWQRWQAFASDPEACDIAGEMTFHEMERHVCRSESIDGDIVGLGTEDGPLQIHEGHAIQTSSRIENTFLGVTRDKFGRREQYHFRYDLNEFGQKSESEPIDVRNSEGVRQLFHVYNPKRVSATRGVTQLAPVFSLSGMLEDINFAKLVQQQIVSCFAILAEKSVNSNGNLPNVDGRSKFSEPSTEPTGSGTRQLEGISPGIFYEGREGEKLTGFSPNVPNSEYFQQVKLILQIVGVNFGLPLCLVLMDGSETNFSGWRGAVDEARKGFVADQLNLVRRWHSPVYRWWLHREMAMEPILQRAAERKGIDIFGHTWQLPTWSYIEPVADAEGDTAQLRNALTSPRRMHAARGKDWETIAEEIIDDNVYAIEKAQAKADKHNQKFPQAPPLSWRDLIPLPMPEGQTMALQDPAAVAAQEEKTDSQPVAKPIARKKKDAHANFDESKIKRDNDGKFGSGGGGEKNGSKEQSVKQLKAADISVSVKHELKLKPEKQVDKLIRQHVRDSGDTDAEKIASEIAYDVAASSSMSSLEQKVISSVEKQLQKQNADVDETHLGGKATTIDGVSAYEWASQESDRIAKEQASRAVLPIVKRILDGVSPKAADDGEWRTTKDGGKIFIGPGGDPKFGGPDGPDVKEGGEQKSAGVTSAVLSLPEPKMKVSPKSARQMEEMIQEDLQQGKTLEEAFRQYDDGGWDYLEFAGKQNAISKVEKALDKHDAKSGNESGTTDEIDGQHWEDWISDNYTGPVEDKLINEFKDRMRAKLPMPEGQTMALQDPAAVAAQEEKADAPPAAKPVAKRTRKKKEPKAAGDGEWRTTKDGGKIFIGPGGDPKFGGPEGPDVKEGGEPAKESAEQPKQSEADMAGKSSPHVQKHKEALQKIETRFNERASQVQSAHNEAVLKLDKQYSDAEQKAVDRIAALKEKQKAEQQAVEAKHESELDELQTRHLEEESEEEDGEGEERREEEKDALDNKHTDELNALAERHWDEESALDDETTAELDELGSKIEDKKSDLESKLEDKLQEIEDKKDEAIEAQIEKSTADAEARHQKQTERLQAKHEAEQQKLEEQIEKMRAALEAKQEKELQKTEQQQEQELEELS